LAKWMHRFKNVFSSNRFLIRLFEMKKPYFKEKNPRNRAKRKGASCLH
jgi:hypothetical protein